MLPNDLDDAHAGADYGADRRHGDSKRKESQAIGIGAAVARGRGKSDDEPRERPCTRIGGHCAEIGPEGRPLGHLLLRHWARGGGGALRCAGAQKHDQQRCQ